MKTPATITQTNGHVAEVRFICDQCHKLIGTRMMLNEEAEEQVKTPILCRRCKQTPKPEK